MLLCALQVLHGLPFGVGGDDEELLEELETNFFFFLRLFAVSLARSFVFARSFFFSSSSVSGGGLPDLGECSGFANGESEGDGEREGDANKDLDSGDGEGEAIVEVFFARFLRGRGVHASS